MFFNAKEAKEELKSFSALPKGSYNMTVAEIEEKEDKFDNPYIKLVFEVTTGQYKNRKHFQNLYMNHPEWEGVVSSSRATLKALCEVAGIDALVTASDMQKLVGGEYVVELGIYKDRNIINAITKPESIQPVSAMADVPL